MRNTSLMTKLIEGSFFNLIVTNNYLLILFWNSHYGFPNRLTLVLSLSRAFIRSTNASLSAKSSFRFLSSLSHSSSSSGSSGSGDFSVTFCRLGLGSLGVSAGAFFSLCFPWTRFHSSSVKLSSTSSVSSYDGGIRIIY